MPRYYAGVGSRETPQTTARLMFRIADWLRRKDYTLRSGGAAGADTAFEAGALGEAEIFYAKDGDRADAIALAAKHHPAWFRCSDYAKKLHARNGLILYGSDLNTPVDFVVCWTRDGKPTGGTGQTLRMATASGIPVFNLFHATSALALRNFVEPPD